MNVIIVGTGYVGLTTGVALAYLGNEVYCIDIDEAKVRDLREGRIPIYEPGLQELLLGSRANLHFESSYDEAHIDQADVNDDRIGDACQCGDVSGDGVANTTDALLIARGLVTDPADLARCDVSGDAENACNTTDALLIARGLAPATPEGQTCPAYTGE